MLSREGGGKIVQKNKKIKIYKLRKEMKNHAGIS